MLNSMFANLLQCIATVMGGTHVPVNCHMEVPGTKTGDQTGFSKEGTM